MPPEGVKISQPVIVQYVAPPNMLWYAPYCTIEGANLFTFYRKMTRLCRFFSHEIGKRTEK